MSLTETLPLAGVPMKEAAFCIDCEMVFRVGPASCPFCASAAWIALERFFLERPAGVVALEDVLHHAGNGLAPARVFAERAAQVLEAYLELGLAPHGFLQRAVVRLTRRSVDAIDDTMRRLRGLASSPHTPKGVANGPRR
jgi:hypothetical protein